MSGPRALLLCLLLSACGGPSVEDRQKAVQAAIDKGDYTTALADVEQAMADKGVAGDPARAWRFESMRLDALARSGDGDKVKENLERLATSYPAQANAALYRALADKLRAAKDTMGAIDVLAAGDRRFPAEHQNFACAIEELKSAGLDPDAENMLRSLGYITGGSDGGSAAGSPCSAAGAGAPAAPATPEGAAPPATPEGAAPPATPAAPATPGQTTP